MKLEQLHDAEIISNFKEQIQSKCLTQDAKEEEDHPPVIRKSLMATMRPVL